MCNKPFSPRIEGGNTGAIPLRTLYQEGVRRYWSTGVPLAQLDSGRTTAML